MNDLTVRSIAELNGLKFYIPDYQRGYRWTHTEVEALLKDIWEFKSDKDPDKGDFYCIQPLVVKRRADESWEVIDGQQRLTTIFIIMSYIKDKVFKDNDNDFDIEYQTREKSRGFLNNINEEEANDNIDFSHIYEAYKCVQEWFPDNPAELRNKGIEMHQTILNEVKFIWYEVSSETNSVQVFTRLNIGKIPLTNAELVKALLLSKNSITLQLQKNERLQHSEQELHLLQLEVSNEWDMIEQQFNDPKLWAFITNDKADDYPTKIELLLNMIAVSKNKNDSFSTFNFFYSKWNEKHNLKKIWEDEIVASFNILHEWYNDRELYHYIGYLITVGITNIRNLLDAYHKAESKTTFKNETILGLVKKSMKNIDIISLDYNKDYKSLMKVLLLFNVITTMKTNYHSGRYPFDAHKRESWSLEHIHARNSENIDTIEGWIEWLKGHVVLLNKGDHKQLVDQVNEALKEKNSLSREIFEEYSSAVLKALSLEEDNADEQEIHGIENMALLSKNINSSLNNSAFLYKRRLVIEKDELGEYIPICTRNVFLKYYNPNPKETSYWGSEDRKNYVDKMQNVLKNYLPTNK